MTWRRQRCCGLEELGARDAQGNRPGAARGTLDSGCDRLVRPVRREREVPAALLCVLDDLGEAAV
jgi:hypothetical protein